MAGALVPLIATLAPGLINLVVGLVHKHAPVAEATGGPGTGISKFTDVFIGVMKDLTDSKVQGIIAALPDPEIVKLVIQSTVNSMKLSGVLGAAQPSSPDPGLLAPSQSMTIRAGQSVTITVAG